MGEAKISVPLEEWAEAIADRAARKAASEALAAHRRECPIGEIKLAVFGEGTRDRPGLSHNVMELQGSVERLWKTRSRSRTAVGAWIMAIIPPLIASALTGLVVWGLYIYQLHAVTKGATP